MSQSIDQREMRLLSGIIGLVLDDQPGASLAALETLRRRARDNAITGGALRAAFDRLCASPSGSPAGSPAGSSDRTRWLEQRVQEQERELARARADLATLAARLRSPAAPRLPPQRRLLRGSAAAGAVLLATLGGLAAMGMAPARPPGPPPAMPAAMLVSPAVAAPWVELLPPESAAAWRAQNTR
jgi:hypothetical protein